MTAKYRDSRTSVPESTSISQPEEYRSDRNEAPWCDLCFEENGRKIKVDGFCPECNSFICKTCLDAHKKSPASRNHIILRGARMPKSQDEKPIKYPDCSKHIGKLKDQFCLDHGEMICNRCVEASHPRCKYTAIPDLCKGLGSKDVQKLKDNVYAIQTSVEATKSSLEANISSVETKRKEITKEVHNIRDKLISKVEQLCSDAVAEMSNQCNKKTSEMSHQILLMSDLSHSLKDTISNITKLPSDKFGPHLFIRIQDLIQNARHFENEIAEINKDLKKVEYSFSMSPEISAFISDSKKLGAMKESLSNLDTLKSNPKIAFSPLQELSIKGKQKERKIQVDILKTRPSKLSPLIIKTEHDSNNCKVEGMDLTSNGHLVLGDWKNKKVKVFSPTNRFLSCTTLPGNPYDVLVLNDTTVMATTDEEKRYVIDISNPNDIYKDKQIPMGYCVTGMTACGNDMVVIRWNEPRCVKRIDMDGNEVWSTTTDKKGQHLFKTPYSVTSVIIDGQLVIIVTDWGKETLIFLDARNGDFIKNVNLKGFGPRGLTVDADNNIYVCYTKTAEICAWSADMKQSRVILPSSRLLEDPLDILYNDNTGELLVSYRSNDTIDRFQLV